MARTVARAIQDLLKGDSEQAVEVHLVNGSRLIGRLEDLEQFDDAAMLVEPSGKRTVIALGSIGTVGLAEQALSAATAHPRSQQVLSPLC